MKSKKIILAIILLVTVLTICMPVFAGQLDPQGYNPTVQTDPTTIKIGKTIIGIIQVVGSIVSVIALSIIGIKFMVGSTEEKAQYKETLLPYVIGCILVFACSNIVGIIYRTVNSGTPATVQSPGGGTTTYSTSQKSCKYCGKTLYYTDTTCSQCGGPQ